MLKSFLPSLVLLPQLTWSLALGSRDTVTCSFSTAANSGDTCDSFSSEWGLTVAQFEGLNPGAQCPDLVGGQLYCVVGTVSVATTTTQTTTTSSIPGGGTNPPPTTTPVPTTTKITTTSSSAPQHQPQQSGLASNCNNFYLVSSGDSCDSIESANGITATQFSTWNPSINSDCTNLLSGYYVCIGVPGSSSTPPTKTTSTPNNGISTPTPTQAGMVDNCNKFHDVVSGDQCGTIASNNGIALSDFYKWNPAVGSSCQSLWAGYYVCVNIVGNKPSPTSSSGNGIATPTPYEPGMVSDCNKFYKVASGDTCYSISQNKGVSTGNIEKWNPNVGSDCSKLFLGDYICIGVK